APRWDGPSGLLRRVTRNAATTSALRLLYSSAGWHPARKRSCDPWNAANSVLTRNCVKCRESLMKHVWVRPESTSEATHYQHFHSILSRYSMRTPPTKNVPS